MLDMLLAGVDTVNARFPTDICARVSTGREIILLIRLLARYIFLHYIYIYIRTARCLR